MTDEKIRDMFASFRAGDSGAHEQMFLYLEEKLRKLVRPALRLDFSRVGLKAETDDVRHDVLLKLIIYLRKQDEDFCSGVGHIDRLTAKLLRRTLIDLARKHFGSLKAHPLGDGADAIDPRLRQSSGLDGWRSQLRVHELVDHLDEEDQEVVELAMYNHLSITEMAKILKINPGNASRRFSKAKERLGQLLLEDEQKAG